MNLEEILFPENLEEADRIQAALLPKLKLIPLKKKPKMIAAADAAFSEHQVIAGVCLFSFPELELLETRVAVEPLTFPYRPGYLSFCEGPAIFKAISRLKHKPELLLLDGQGIAHPRKMGLATFIGILLEIPSIGCAKSILVGQFQDPRIKKGNYSEIVYRGEIMGYALRSRTGAKPIFISPGHLITPQESLNLIQLCLSEYRIPEPLRQAHFLSQKIKLAHL
ncbi:MAG: endonuclease V [Candidatus Aminicenantes bacterium]|nr:endonuclease V [Candidatus Aminicenantes bacterium]